MATPLTGLIFPVIHLNGTSKLRLVEGYITAMQAVEAAIVAVRETAPNGRDYYPKGPAAINEAMDQHASRLDRLRAVYAELEEIAFAADQGDKP